MTAHRRGTLTVPDDELMAHATLMLAALAIGRTRLSGLPATEAILETARNLTLLGVRITPPQLPADNGDHGTWEVTGCGVGGLTQPGRPLEFGRSSVAVPLMLGLIAGHDITVRLTGDAGPHGTQDPALFEPQNSAQSQTLAQTLAMVLQPLRQMGLAVLEDGRDRLLVTVRGTADLLPIIYTLPIANPLPITNTLPNPSLAMKSAILLAGLHAPGATTVIEPAATSTSDTSSYLEQLIVGLGGRVESDSRDGTRRVTVHGDANLQA